MDVDDLLRSAAAGHTELAHILRGSGDPVVVSGSVNSGRGDVVDERRYGGGSGGDVLSSTTGRRGQGEQRTVTLDDDEEEEEEEADVEAQFVEIAPYAFDGYGVDTMDYSGTGHSRPDAPSYVQIGGNWHGSEDEDVVSTDVELPGSVDVEARRQPSSAPIPQLHISTTPQSVPAYPLGVPSSTASLPPPPLPAPSGVPVEDVEAFHRVAERRLERYKKRITKLDEARKKLSEVNGKLRRELDELERERIEANKDMFRMMASSGNKQESREAQRRRRENRELLLGFQGLDDVDSDDSDLNPAEHGREGDGLWGVSHALHAAGRVKRWLRDHYPLEADLKFVQARYGSGISAYFQFYRFLVVNSMFFIILWGYAFARQWIRYDESYDESQGSLPTWTFFSAWVGGSFFYVMSIVTCIAFLVVVSVIKWIADDRHVALKSVTETDAMPQKFSKLAWHAVDFTAVDERLVTEHQLSLGQQMRTFLNEDLIQARILNRTRKDKVVLALRRSIGLTLNIGFLFAGWVAIVVIALNQRNISVWFEDNMSGVSNLADFAAPLTTAFINAILPEITFVLTSFEKWDDETTLLKHQMWRLYFGRQLNLFINVFTYYSIAQEASFTSQVPTTFDEEVYACGEDAAGAGLFSLVMVEFFVHKFVSLSVYSGKQLIIATCMPSLKLEEFRVSEGIIWLLYFQSLMWVSLPIYPFGSIISSICLLLNFKFEKLLLTKLRGKPASTWSAHDTSTFFAKFYNVTLLMCFGSFYYFLQSSWDCSSVLGVPQGPFADTPDHLPWNAVEVEAESTGFTWFYEIVSSPVAWLSLALTLMLLYAFQLNKIESLHKRHQIDSKVLESEIVALKREVTRKTRELRIHKRRDDDEDDERM